MQLALKWKDRNMSVYILAVILKETPTKKSNKGRQTNEFFNMITQYVSTAGQTFLSLMVFKKFNHNIELQK